MKSYVRLTQDKKKYITGIVADEETISVTFADKTVHADIENTEENLRALEGKMESQLEDALKRQPLYAIRTALAAGSVIAAETGAVVLSQMESIQQHPDSLLMTGALVLAAGIPTLGWYIREQSRLNELSKVRYRNRHFDKFKNIDSYNHALDSSSNGIIDLFESEDSPLGVLNIDRYTKRDLEIIVREMEREDSMKNDLGITYVKTK